MWEMFKFACVGIGVLVSGLATATPVADMLLPIGPNLDQAGWKVLTLSRKPPTHFVGRVDGAIKVTAESSVTFLYRDVPSASQHKRYLSWRWRVDLAMTPIPAVWQHAHLQGSIQGVHGFAAQFVPA